MKNTYNRLFSYFLFMVIAGSCQTTHPNIETTKHEYTALDSLLEVYVDQVSAGKLKPIDAVHSDSLFNKMIKRIPDSLLALEIDRDSLLHAIKETASLK